MIFRISHHWLAPREMNPSRYYFATVREYLLISKGLLITRFA